jgi:hypothetical protein
LTAGIHPLVDWSSCRHFQPCRRPFKFVIPFPETADRDKRRHLVWDIDKQLQEDGARPIIYHTRAAN